MTAPTSQDFTRGASSSRRKLTGLTSLFCGTKGLRVGAMTSEIASLARACFKAFLPTRPVAPNSKGLMVALSPPLSRCVVPSGSYSGSHLTLSHDSDLRKTTVHKNFRPGDIATLIRCEKHYSPSNFIRSAKPAKWDCAGDHLAPLLACFGRCKQITQAGRVDGARADRIDSNCGMLEIRGQRARERADGRLRGAVNTIRGEAFAAYDRGIENDRRTVRHEGKRLLYCE